jgi:hypothetical protein
MSVHVNRGCWLAVWCRWCLHLNLQASSDDLMMHLNSTSSSGVGTRSRGSRQQEVEAPVHSQIRSGTAGGPLLVQFGSAAAAGEALAEAAVLETMALGSAAGL